MSSARVKGMRARVSEKPANDDTDAELHERIEGWRGLVERWPGRWYEISEGCDMTDRIALDCLRVSGEVEMDRVRGLFRGVTQNR
jgi:hypothetical protein